MEDTEKNDYLKHTIPLATLKEWDMVCSQMKEKFQNGVFVKNKRRYGKHVSSSATIFTR